MKIITVTLIGLVAFSGFAGVIVYDNHYTYTTTGGGTASTVAISGWTVLDTQTGEMTELAINKRRKVFEVATNEIEINYVTGTSGKQYMVLYVQPLSGFSGLGTATGVASSLNIGTSTYTAAKTQTAGSSYITVVRSEEHTP